MGTWWDKGQEQAQVRKHVAGQMTSSDRYLKDGQQAMGVDPINYRWTAGNWSRPSQVWGPSQAKPPKSGILCQSLGTHIVSGPMTGE